MGERDIEYYHVIDEIWPLCQDGREVLVSPRSASQQSCCSPQDQVPSEAYSCGRRTATDYCCLPLASFVGGSTAAGEADQSVQVSVNSM